MTKITEASEKLSPSVISKLENDLGINLPVSYKRFLLEHNGGRPTPDCFNFKGETTGSCVDWFLGIHNKEHNNLLRYLETYKKRIPHNFFPIAHDPGSNLVCLSVAGADHGAVYFWDHEEENETDGTHDYSNVISVADSFDEFIGKLYEMEV